MALADKLDTLVGFWAIDEKPTGSKDPFALRRAALGVIRLVLENGLKLKLQSVLADAYWRHVRQDRNAFRLFIKSLSQGSYQPLSVWNHADEWSTHDGDGEVTIDCSAWKLPDSVEFRRFVRLPDSDEMFTYFLQPKPSDPSPTRFTEDSHTLGNPSLLFPDLLAFFHDRLKVYLRDKGIRHDILDAVISPEADDLLEIQNRAQALQAFLETEAGTNLLAVYKRAANILKAEEKKFPNEAASYSGPGHVNYLQEHAEKALGAALDRSNTESTAALAKQDYAAALHALAKVHQPADAFFTDVMVNAEDAALRLNRLRLLGSLRRQLHAVADFSKIAG